MKIALLMPDLAGGGAEKVFLILARAFVAQGHQVQLLIYRHEGAYLEQIPAGLSVTTLQRSKQKSFFNAVKWDWRGVWLYNKTLRAKPTYGDFRYADSLVAHLRQNPVDILLSGLESNFLAGLVKPSLDPALKLVMSVHNPIIAQAEAATQPHRRHYPTLVSRLYPRADAAVCVSHWVADDFRQIAYCQLVKTQVIYNPVITPEFEQLAALPCHHPWLQPDQKTPVILAIGRLHQQKNFASLLEAFAKLLSQKTARLIILGEGELRQPLEQQAIALGIQENLSMPGFVDNPLAYLSRAQLMVMSSLYEGLPLVLVEALACGTPVVSTDHAAAGEVLEQGRYGTLVPVNNSEALAIAMTDSLQQNHNTQALQQHGQTFSMNGKGKAYEELFHSLLGRRDKVGAEA